MKILTNPTDPELSAVLMSGGLAVIKTDTLYGLVARADDQKAVERVYSVKDRSEHKACIVLIADTSQLLPGTVFDAVHERLASKYWPGPVTLIIPVHTDRLGYLTRGGATLAYRLPNDDQLRALIRRTGPLIAPSANPEGKTPAHSVSEAIAYFGDTVDVYADRGEVKNATASRIITVDEAGIEQVIR